jgi:hypothetical protein
MFLNSLFGENVIKLQAKVLPFLGYFNVPTKSSLIGEKLTNLVTLVGGAENPTIL